MTVRRHVKAATHTRARTIYRVSQEQHLGCLHKKAQLRALRRPVSGAAFSRSHSGSSLGALSVGGVTHVNAAHADVGQGVRGLGVLGHGGVAVADVPCSVQCLCPSKKRGRETHKVLMTQ